jgi:hypothetical protein
MPELVTPELMLVCVADSVVADMCFDQVGRMDCWQHGCRGTNAHEQEMRQKTR